MESKFFKIGDIFNVEKGSLQSSKNVEGQFDFITASAEWKTHNEYSHDCEALVFAAGAAGSLGRTHYVNGKFIASDLCFVLTPKDNAIDKVDLKFYFYYFNLNRDTIVKNTATGTSKLAINMKNFISYCIPLPSIEYQKLGRERIEKVESKINKFNLIFEKNLIYVSKLRQSILKEAVQGKLVPQDPNDEPASILLEKIKKEKERLIKEGKIKKEKPLPPIKDDEIPYDLPKGWEWVRLGEICELITKGSSPKWQGVNYIDNENGVLFITSENVGNYELILTNKKYLEWKFNEIEPRSILKKGDILMNIVGASIGRTAIFDLDDVANINQAVCLIRTIETNIYRPYLLYFFNSNICINYMFDKQVDNARANLSMGNIAKFLIPFPPLNEQKRIVEKVDRLMALCDELERNIEQCKKDSELLMQSVLQEAFKEK